MGLSMCTQVSHGDWHRFTPHTDSVNANKGGVRLGSNGVGVVGGVGGGGARREKFVTPSTAPLGCE